MKLVNTFNSPSLSMLFISQFVLGVHSFYGMRDTLLSSDANLLAFVFYEVV